jgi:valyl-tRNA synthetase
MKSGDNEEKDRAATVLLDVLAESLKLLHPLLPFVTEEIYQKLPNAEKMLINCQYPAYDEKRYSAEEEKNFASLQSLVGMVRTLRSECGITPDKKLRVTIRPCEALQKPFRENEGLIKLLAGINELAIETEGETERPANKPAAGSIGMAGSGFEVFVFIAEAVDTAALKKKFGSDLEKDRKYIETLKAKLANEQFVKNAPAELVIEQQNKLNETLLRTEKFNSYLRDL